MNRVVKAEYTGSKPGLGGSKIKIEFDSTDFKQGKHITYDFRNGSQLRIEVLAGKTAICKLITTSEKDWLPEIFLEPGTEYFMFDNKLYED